MFNKQKNNPVIDSDVGVQSIPADFYAGANPVIKFKKVEQEVTLNKQQARPAEKALLDKTTVAGAGKKMHPANAFTSKKVFIFLIVIFFVLFVVGSTAYYTGWYKKIFSNKTADVQLITPPKITVPNTPTPTENNNAEDQNIIIPEENTLDDIKSLSGLPLDFPSMLLGDSLDFDDDGLTDKTEEVFNTDPSMPDTDEDLYSDGHEIYYLYNPAGKEPNRLIASGLVADFTNTAYGYKIYYPKDWALGDVNGDGQQILFSTLSGENIEIRSYDLAPGQNFTTWFGEFASQEKVSDLEDFTGYFEERGKMRKDGLVFYFVDGNNVYVLLYHTLDTAVVNYRSVLEMMARSFRSPANQKSINLAP